MPQTRKLPAWSWLPELPHELVQHNIVTAVASRHIIIQHGSSPLKTCSESSSEMELELAFHLLL